MISKFKKLSLKFLLAIFVITSMAGTLLFMRPAKAIPVEVVSDAQGLAEQVMAKIERGLKISVINAAVQSISYFMRKIAYDTAVYAASGGKGTSALMFKDGFGAYLGKTADSAMGKAIDELGTGIGLDLCKIPDVKLDLAFRLGLKNKYTPPAEPDCTFTQMKDTWTDPEQWKSKYGDSFGDAVENVFNASFSVDQTDLGLFMSATEKVDRFIARETAVAQLKREEQGAVKGVEKLISGTVVTPSFVVKKQIESLSPSEQQKMSMEQMGHIMGTGMAQVIPSTLGMFLNTLVGEMANNFITKGMFPFGIGYEEDGGERDLTEYATSAGVGGRRVAEKMFAELLTPKTVVIEKYNILGTFNSCPSSPGVDNCVMDVLFVAAVREAELGKPLTIAEAIKKDWLKGSWKLVSPTNRTENVSKNCYNHAYCYTNIKKLRKARILPLGFEIAALNSNPDAPWTLKTVVDGFNDCYFDSAGNVVYDPKNYPYCRLIDPNWVLKAPPARCNSNAYTNNLLTSAGPQRMQECVDTSSCVGYDSKGNCLAYGYCLREKNVWKANANKCDPQNRTCIAFKDSKKNSVSYLYRTLDTGQCTSNNVGCQSYSLFKNKITNKWDPYSTTYGMLSAYSKNTIINFNKQVSTQCSYGSAGCSAFEVAAASGGASNTKPQYVKKAPFYLGCYSSSYSNWADYLKYGFQWPQTKVDLAKLTPHKDCANYAQVCIPDEVNCDWYTDQQDFNNKIPGRYKVASVDKTGKLNWNDQCHSDCVGYDAYKEISSSYSNGHDPVYITPAKMKSCTQKEEGCTGFTNLDITVSGLEKTEYYSYLRPCIKPDTSKQKSYHTYEGSTVSGYQLKTYILEKDTTGAPKYFYKTSAEKDSYSARCNEKDYKAKVADDDCRQFNDDQGKVYYALLDKTITVDLACTPYRMNGSEMYWDKSIKTTNLVKAARLCKGQKSLWNSQENKCYSCFQNGEYKDGYCLYNGLPTNTINNAGTSDSCTSDVESCRAYKGSASNVVRSVFLEDKITFENSSAIEALAGWNCALGATTKKACKAFVSAESTYVGQHSLGYNFNPSLADKADEGISKTNLDMRPGRSYVLTFWAKSSSKNKIIINLKNNNKNLTTVKMGIVDVGDDWNYYRIGPIDLPASSASNMLVTSTNLEFHFDLSAVTPATQNQMLSLFIDNLELQEMKDYIYRVKKSLKSTSYLQSNQYCDDNIDDNLPGHALGCRAYTNKKNREVNLTGFEYLCRENSIGCTAVIDTYNTLNNPYPDFKNLWLEGKPGQKTSINITVNKKLKTFSCDAPKGQNGCYVNIYGLEMSELKKLPAFTSGAIRLTTSTVYTQSDTPTSSPMYLVIDENSTCKEVDRGCKLAGKQIQTPTGMSYETVLVKDDPNTYNKTLCTNEAVGCDKYSSGNDTYYFKDPKIIGQKVCKYSNSVENNKVKYKGWFWDGVGKCSKTTDKYCQLDGDCPTGEKCAGIGKQECYPEYLKSGNEFGLWSYGTVGKYEDFVGACPSLQSGCTEYIDRADKDESYYFIDDKKLQVAKSECGSLGKVSQNYGCVLFDQTDKPNKLYNTYQSYLKSEKNKDDRYGLVIPVNSVIKSQPNDANVIMKVVRDRECGEWLQCRALYRIWDKDISGYKRVCEDIGRCNELSNVDDADDQSGVGVCNIWIDGQHEDADRIFTEELYSKREVKWEGMDYSGHSLLNMYPIEELSQVNLKPDADEGDWRLLKKIPCGSGENCMYPKLAASYLCKNEVNKKSTEGELCGFGKTGVCKSRVCVQNPDGTIKDIEKNAPKHECRAYPEKNAPYPNTLDMMKAANVYNNVNYCNESSGSTAEKGAATSAANAYKCECDYTKVDYGGSLSKYWNYDEPRGSETGSQATICSGGTYDGMECTEKNGFCAGDATKTIKDRPGVCLDKKKETKLVGWRGFCLEGDPSKSLHADDEKKQCLTWYPVDSLNGAIDINFLNQGAGYMPPDGKNGKYYCSMAKGNFSNDNFGGNVLQGGEITKTNDPLKVRPYVVPLVATVLGNSHKLSFNSVETVVNLKDFMSRETKSGDSFGGLNHHFFVTDFFVDAVYAYNGSSEPNTHMISKTDGSFFWLQDYPPQIVKTVFDGKSGGEFLDKKKTKGLEINKPLSNLYLRDIDSIVIEIGKIFEETGGGASSDYPTELVGNTDIIPAGSKFIIRNGSVNKIDIKGAEYNRDPVVTWYGGGNGDKAICDVFEADPITGKPVKDKEKSSQTETVYKLPGSKEKCLAKDLETELKVDNRSNNGGMGRAETKMYKLSKDDKKKDDGEGLLSHNEFWGKSDTVPPKYNDYTIMRFIYDDQESDESTLKPWKYIEEGYGFFPEFGDRTASAKHPITHPGVPNFQYTNTAIFSDHTSPGGLFGGIGGDEDDQNAIEVMVVFDEKEKLQGVYFAYSAAGVNCITDDSCDKFFPIRVYANLRENCKEVVEVYDNKQNNAAWTDRLWKNQNTKYETGLGYVYDIEAKPFGSLDIINTKWLGSGQHSGLAILYGPRQGANGKGVWYGCPKNFYGSMCGGELKSNSPDYTIRPDITKVAKNSYPTYTPKNALIFPYHNVEQLFARSYGMHYLKEGDLQYTLQTSAPRNSYDYTEVLNDPLLTAPEVWSVDTDNCITENNQHKCLEGKKNKITVNNKSGEDVLITSYPAKAIFKWYAFADSNKMPIREVTLDFDDGSVIGPKPGMFRNARGGVKGKCNTTSKTCTFGHTSGLYKEIETGVSCDPSVNDANGYNDSCDLLDRCMAESIAPTFGHIKDVSCSNAYYQVEYPYQCTKNSLKFKDPCPGSNTSKFPEGCCVYEPKVRVKDNWGWCNGKCTSKDKNGKGKSIGGDGCYDKKDITGDMNDDECFFIADTNNPWTDGTTRILVIPKKN